MEILIGTLALMAGLVAGTLVGWRIQPVSRTKRHIDCHMCGRSSDSALIRWQIRGRSMDVCIRCHPFYKLRFDQEVRDDTHSFETESNEIL